MTEAAALQPPEPSETLTLSAPEPVKPVATTQAPAMAPKVDPAAVPGLQAKVSSYVDQLMSTDTRSPEFAAQADDVRKMGDQDIRAAADVSNRMLEMPVRELKEGGVSESSKVSQSLLELRRTVEELDPSEATFGKKLLGFLPFGDKLTDYFRRYESSQSQLNAIVQSLYNGQDELRKDNAALNLEKQNLWDTMARLNQYIYIAENLDKALATKIAELEASDPERAQALREDVLFYVRQKHQDLLTQLAVSIQGYLAMDIIMKNNVELIKGVDRATTTTVAALRTAVIVAQALANQRLVLDQITALNTTTSNMIASTSKMLADQSATIQSQAASATVGIPQLQQAFQNIYATLDSISTFKTQALDSMSQTIGVLETETTKANEYLERARRSDSSQVGNGSLDIGRV
ncbi:toxic anion resistance protein [Cellulosimicrobium arenosum]|uniref:Toxic anion resistance protein n=1 Tax=Cellulosimicrobium arenosum TaxID=2708133 RepID=A0A927PH71_9MICO|nr:toxic anion resistance protein [Cellulosimicrobium arenosum]MBD8080615.1 toxic anion resistance protein [Cellulosimicrobium arenosum]